MLFKRDTLNRDAAKIYLNDLQINEIVVFKCEKFIDNANLKKSELDNKLKELKSKKEAIDSKLKNAREQFNTDCKELNTQLDYFNGKEFDTEKHEITDEMINKEMPNTGIDFESNLSCILTFSVIIVIAILLYFLLIFISRKVFWGIIAAILSCILGKILIVGICLFLLLLMIISLPAVEKMMHESDRKEIKDRLEKEEEERVKKAIADQEECQLKINEIKGKLESIKSNFDISKYENQITEIEIKEGKTKDMIYEIVKCNNIVSLKLRDVKKLLESGYSLNIIMGRWRNIWDINAIYSNLVTSKVFDLNDVLKNYQRDELARQETERLISDFSSNGIKDDLISQNAELEDILKEEMANEQDSSFIDDIKKIIAYNELLLKSENTLSVEFPTY